MLIQKVEAQADGQTEGGVKDMTTWRGRQHLAPDPCPILLWPQICRALQQLLFPSKAFSWPRHVAIALILLVLVNVLVICVLTIQDIFGVIGQYHNPSP